MNITHIVFDLGGVLVELDGQPIRNDWLQNQQTLEHCWQRWLNSPLVQQFDRGKIPAHTFATKLIEQLNLNTTADAFIDWFVDWPKDFFPGSLELIDSLQDQYTLSIFSNITALHWPRYHSVLSHQNVISHYFASYQIGLAKPELDSFTYVINTLNAPPESILFLDDNRVNIDAALVSGIQAQCVKGIDAAKQYLDQVL